MKETCKLCQSMGFEEVYVEAESEDIDAVEFYRRTKYSNEMGGKAFYVCIGKAERLIIR